MWVEVFQRLGVWSQGTIDGGVRTFGMVEWRGVKHGIYNGLKCKRALPTKVRDTPVSLLFCPKLYW